MEQESVPDTPIGGTALQSETWVEKSARKISIKFSCCSDESDFRFFGHLISWRLRG